MKIKKLNTLQRDEHRRTCGQMTSIKFVNYLVYTLPHHSFDEGKAFCQGYLL